MNPELEVTAVNKISKIINDIKTMEECGHASDVIDVFEESSDDKASIKSLREALCDKTFETFKIFRESKK